MPCAIMGGMPLQVIHLSARRNSLHPWIYSRMVRHPRRRPAPGTLVEVVSREGAFVGRGVYNGASTIALRLLTENPGEDLDGAFFQRVLARALGLRTEVLRLPEVTDAWRWVHGEADGLSGLVVDRYADVVVVEPYSAGYAGETLGWVVEGIRGLAPGVRVAVRADPMTERRERFDLSEAARVHPAGAPVVVREHALRMEVDLQAGRKTGFFLDQRDQRSRVAALAAGRSVLDCFCYTGGFAIASMLGGARRAVGVDLDEAALATGRQNAGRNGVDVRFRRADAFEVLREMAGAAEGERPDLLILDPARQASLRAEMGRAARQYLDMNRLAMQAVLPGGLLLSCSCTGLVSEPEFLQTLTRAASEARVALQVLLVGGAAPDHPWTTPFPEGRYLKAVLARVLPLAKVGPATAGGRAGAC
ncbi:MAG: class I SAM-dependent rRNA methyltransferase [Planctomycetes bacterium]|nr:class I SAM-dependent rRNA methyltransferase [Planctomycetota bacterium]